MCRPGLAQLRGPFHDCAQAGCGSIEGTSTNHELTLLLWGILPQIIIVIPNIETLHSTT